MKTLLITIYYLLLTISIQAQGGSDVIIIMDDNAFLPTNVIGLVKWYAQSYTKVVDSDSVNAWIDLTANDTATQTANNFSCPRAIDNELNGYPVLRFDGSNDYLFFDTFDYKEYSVFVVFKATAQAVTSGLIARAYNHVYFWVKLITSADGTNPNKLAFTVNATTIYSTNAVTGDWKIASLLYSEDDDYQGMYLNGILQNETTAGDLPETYDALDQPSIGVIAETAGSYVFPYKGDIAEILIYNRRVASSERTKIETYLNDK